MWQGTHLCAKLAAILLLADTWGNCRGVKFDSAQEPCFRRVRIDSLWPEQNGCESLWGIANTGMKAVSCVFRRSRRMMDTIFATLLVFTSGGKYEIDQRK